MKIVNVTPPDNKTTMGAFYVQPIESFSEKGHNWVRQFIFKAKSDAFVRSDGIAFVVRYWSEPKYEVVDCGFTGYWDIEQKGKWVTCKCKDCLEGRKQVKKGWKPE